MDSRNGLNTLINEKMKDYYFWVIGFNDEGVPRQGFTMTECVERLKKMPERMTLEEIEEKIESIKPKCQVCLKPAEAWVKDETFTRDMSNMVVVKCVVTMNFFCKEHDRPPITKYCDV